MVKEADDKKLAGNNVVPVGTEQIAPLPRIRLFVLATVGFITVTTGLVTIGLLPLMSVDFGVSESQTGLLTAGYAGIIVFTVVPVMAITRVARRRALLTAALTIFVLSNVLVSLSPAFAVAMGGRLLGGIAQGLVWALLGPMVARMVPHHQLGRAMAIVFGGSTLGLAAGAPLGALLGDVLGWRAIFMILSALTGVLIAAVVFVFPNEEVGESRVVSLSMLGAIREPGVANVALVGPLLLLGNFAMLTYLASFVVYSGLPPALVGAVLSWFGIAGLVGVLIAGATANRWGRGSMITFVACWIASLVLLAIAPSWPELVLILIAVWGASTAAASIHNQTALIRASGNHKDAATTIMVLLTQGGVALGAVLGSVAIETVGLHLLPIVAAVPVSIALVIVLVARKSAYPAGRIVE